MKELTVKNIADMFGVSKQTIYSWVDKGILTPVKKTPTNRLYFNKEDVEKLQNSMIQSK